MSELPPRVTEENGQLVRYITRTSADGTERQQRKFVALTIEEAKARRCDYYHPELGWILEGYKLESDRPIESVMADASQSVAAPIEQQEKKKGKESVSNA